jgi:uncharacterized protein involved in exopolysaccharide biosynthesis
VVAYVCNLNFSGGREKRILSSRPVLEKVSKALSQERNANKRTEGMTHVVGEGASPVQKKKKNIIFLCLYL